MKQEGSVFSSTSDILTEEEVEEALDRCLARARLVEQAQEKAMGEYEKLRSRAILLNIAALITPDKRLGRPSGENGLFSKPSCRKMTSNKNYLKETNTKGDDAYKSIAEDSVYGAGSIVLTLGKMGEDPRNDNIPGT